MKATKEVKRVVAAGRATDTKEALSRLYQALDKAAKTHAITKNKAGRLKSRLTKFVQGSGVK